MLILFFAEWKETREEELTLTRHEILVGANSGPNYVRKFGRPNRLRIGADSAPIRLRMTYARCSPDSVVRSGPILLRRSYARCLSESATIRLSYAAPIRSSELIPNRIRFGRPITCKIRFYSDCRMIDIRPNPLRFGRPEWHRFGRPNRL